MTNQGEYNIPKKVCKEKYRKIKQKVKSVRQKKLKRRRYFKQLNLITRNVKAKIFFLQHYRLTQPKNINGGVNTFFEMQLRNAAVYQKIKYTQFLKLHFLQTKRNIKKYNGVSKDIVNPISRLYFL